MRILSDHGIYPPEDGRKNSDWGKFFDAHKDVLAACDFATYELLTPNGLVRESILFFENLSTREVWLGKLLRTPRVAAAVADLTGLEPRQAMDALGDAWTDGMTQAEMARLVRLLVESVEINEDEIVMELRTGGMETLAKEAYEI